MPQLVTTKVKRIYVKGFNIHTSLKDGKTYIEVVSSRHPEAIPVDVPEYFQPTMLHNVPYMPCLDRHGNCLTN